MVLHVGPRDLGRRAVRGRLPADPAHRRGPGGHPGLLQARRQDHVRGPEQEHRLRRGPPGRGVRRAGSRRTARPQRPAAPDVAGLAAQQGERVSRPHLQVEEAGVLVHARADPGGGVPRPGPGELPHVPGQVDVDHQQPRAARGGLLAGLRAAAHRQPAGVGAAGGLSGQHSAAEPAGGDAGQPADLHRHPLLLGRKLRPDRSVVRQRGHRRPVDRPADQQLLGRHLDHAVRPALPERVAVVRHRIAQLQGGHAVVVRQRRRHPQPAGPHEHPPVQRTPAAMRSRSVGALRGSPRSGCAQLSDELEHHGAGRPRHLPAGHLDARPAEHQRRCPSATTTSSR